MGWNPEQDEDTAILNGGFDDDTVWNKDADWSISGGKAHFISTEATPANISQDVDWNEGFRYRITFTISNFSFVNAPAAGIGVIVGAIVSAAYTANGTYTYEIVAGSALTNFGFKAAGDVAGDTVDIDDVSLIKLEGYVEEVLEIEVTDPTTISTFEATETDFYSSVASRTDKSSCLISFDI